MAARLRNIVVGYDASDASRRALHAAADLAGYGSTLAIVTVRTREVDSSAGRDARARLHARHIEARYLEPVGEAAEQIVETAVELGADLVVVGRRAPSELEAALGSVSSRVVADAPCDVLVVR